MAVKMMFTLTLVYTGIVSGLMASNMMQSDSSIIRNRSGTPVLPSNHTSKYIINSKNPELNLSNISATFTLLADTIKSTFLISATNGRDINKTRTFSLNESSIRTNSSAMVNTINKSFQDYLDPSIFDFHQNLHFNFTPTSIHLVANDNKETKALSEIVTSYMSPVYSTDVIQASVDFSSGKSFDTTYNSVNHTEIHGVHESKIKFIDQHKSSQTIGITPTLVVTSSLTWKTKSFEFEQMVSSETHFSQPNSALEPTKNTYQVLEKSLLSNQTATVTPLLKEIKTNIYILPSSYSSQLQITPSNYDLPTTAIITTKTIKKESSQRPKTLYKFSYEIEFSGECKTLESNEAIAEMWGGLVNIVGRETGFRDITVEPLNILCQPLRLSFNVHNTTHRNLTERLKSIVDNNTFIITVIVDEYKTVFIAKRIVSLSERMSVDYFMFGLNEIDIIIIICATIISVLLVCAGLLICAREYYLKKRTRSFTLSSFMSKSSKSYDYSLTKIPRPNSTYSENGIRLKSADSEDGQHTSRIPSGEQETSVSDLHLKVKSNDNGIIVGVTGVGFNHRNDELLDNYTEGHGDQSKEMLCSNNEEPAHSVDNPIYFADDERFLDV